MESNTVVGLVTDVHSSRFMHSNFLNMFLLPTSLLRTTFHYSMVYSVCHGLVMPLSHENPSLFIAFYFYCIEMKNFTVKCI